MTFPGGKGSIRRQLMFWGLAVLVALLILSTLAGLIYSGWQIRKSEAVLQTEIASLTARRIQSFIDNKIQRLQDTAAVMTLHPLGGAEQRLLGLLLLRNDRAFTEFSILDDQGRELQKVSERAQFVASDLEDHGDSIKFITASRGGIYISSVYTADKTEPCLTFAIPLKAHPQKIIGVLVAEVNLKFLWEVIGESRFGYGGYGYLVDERGNLIAHQDPSLVLKNINLRDLPKVREFLSNPSQDAAPGEEGEGIMGKPVLSTFARVPVLDWAVVLEEPVEAALGDLKTMERYALLLIGMGLLVGTVTIVWAGNRISKPIRELRRGVETIGGENLDHRTELKTGDEVEDLASAFNKTTDALQASHSTLEQKVRQRTQELAALHDVTKAVNQSLDLEVVLQAVIEKITEIFKFDTTRIFLFNAKMDELKLRASFEIDPHLWSKINRFKRGQGIIGRVADSGVPMIFADIRSDPRYQAMSHSKATQNARLSFFAVFPIKTQARIFGAMVFNGESPRSLAEDEIKLLTSMSEHIGVALEKASLFEEVKARSEQLSVLNTIGGAVSQSLDLDVVAKEAVNKLADTLGFDACWIYLRNFTGTELHLKACRGLSEDVARPIRRRNLNFGIIGAVFNCGKPLVFEDVQNDLEYRKLSRRKTIASVGYATMANFPIKAKGKITGVLSVANLAKHQFATGELQLLESLAQEIGVAVENAILFGEVKEKTFEMAKINRELREASRAKSEFMAAMSHELRTPLNVIIGNADLVQDGLFGSVNADQERALQKIARYSRMLLKLINDVLTLSRMEAKKLTLEVSKVDVAEIIKHAQTHVEEINRGNHLEVHWDVQTSVRSIDTDALKLEEILQNLIGNAFKFTATGRIDVQVRNLCEANRLEFTVADTGIGIEAGSLARIFEEFEQLKEAHTGNYSGVGLGLSIVKKYLELMDGDIKVESQPGRGSTFTFSLQHSIQASC
jgi:signal transduction histidine kinase/HAMP domain-containing protein/type II secretory pathway pseudopilin PulG